MRTFEDIIERAKLLKLPMTEYEFRDTKLNPVPDPPFLVYLKPETQRGTDEKNRIREIAGSLELYTDRRPDPDLEAKIENDVLFDVEFEKYSARIPDENMVQTSYDFRIVQKKAERKV